MSLAVSHGAVTLSAECSVEYNSLVEGLFALVQQQLDRGAKLRDGAKAPFGWTELRISMVDDVATFQEPDFDTNPLTRSRRNLDFSFMHLKGLSWKCRPSSRE